MIEPVGKLEPETVTYKWTIEESNIIAKRTGERLSSPLIQLTDTKHCIIWLFPRGENEDYKDYLALYLGSVKGDFEASVKFSILDNHGQTVDNSIRIGDPSLFKEHKGEGYSWGFPKCWKLEDVIEKSIVTPSSSSRGEILTILLEVNFKENLKENRSLESAKEARLKEFDGYEQLLDNDEFSDVTLAIEGKRIHVHKSILANKSEVFKAMFTNNMKETEEGVVNIEDVSYDVMKELMLFVYAGKVNNLEDVAMDLFIAADKYLIENLKNMCERHLIQSITVENVLECLNFASLHNALQLKNESMSFFQSNVKDTILQTKFKVGDLDKSILDEVLVIIANSVKC